MIEKTQDSVELELLAILYYRYDIGFELLQLKKEHFVNKDHQEIFSLIVDSYCRYGVVDNSFIFDNLNNITFDKYTDIISNENLPTSHFREHFNIAQNIILENYKKRVIVTLTNKLTSKQISLNEYTDKVNKLDAIQVQKNGTRLTVEEINEGLKLGKRVNLSFYPKLNSVLELFETDLLVIGASAGTGKTSFLLNLFAGLMKDYRCLYLNMEVGRGTVYPRLLAIKANIPVNDVRIPKSSLQKQNIEMAKIDLSKKDAFLETKVFSITEVENYIKLMRDEEKHTILFVDHLGWIQCDKNYRNSNKYEIVTDNIQSLRRMCLKYNITIITASQLKRKNADEPPKISDLRDSGEIEQSASSVILLSRKSGYSGECLHPEMSVHIAKNRDGIETVLDFEYDKTKQIFKEKEGY